VLCKVSFWISYDHAYGPRGLVTIAVSPLARRRRSGLGTRAKGGWVLRGVRDMCQSSIHGRSLAGGVWYCVAMRHHSDGEMGVNNGQDH